MASSDIEFYRIEGMAPDQITKALDGTEDMVFCGNTDNGKLYDCNWVGGSYVEVRNKSPQIKLDGQCEGFHEVLSRLEEVLCIEPLEVVA